jgi:deoxyxylulose-5-phosphate synthase
MLLRLKMVALKVVWAALCLNLWPIINTKQMVRLGIPDQFIEHGDQPELWAECGYDAAGIAAEIKKFAIKRDNTHIIAS